MDQIQTFGNSLVQHGAANARAYLMKLDPNDLPELIGTLDTLARTRGYGKIFAKIPASQWPYFENAGYRIEAKIPEFFGPDNDACFLGRFLELSRADEKRAEEVATNLKLAQLRHGKGVSRITQEIKAMLPEDAEEMAALYQKVFATYPFPIHDPDYLRTTMQSHIRYFGIRQDDKLVALASAEEDRSTKSVEMTDFATDPDFLGQGFAASLLAHMEDKVIRDGFRTAFTIARAYSPGMNITFAKLSWTFAGTLTHNTDISGDIESMNIWYKNLQEAL